MTTRSLTWTDHEIEVLGQCLAVGMEAAEIAGQHIPGRTVEAVEARIRFQRDKERRRRPIESEAPREHVTREPCPRCGTRQDIGCAHTRAAEARIGRAMARVNVIVSKPDPAAFIVPEPPARIPRPFRKQINLHLTADRYDALKAVADDRGLALSRVAADMLDEALTASGAPSASTPNIPADVIAAWQEDGRPFGQFVNDMLELGVAEVRRFRKLKAA